MLQRFASLIAVACLCLVSGLTSESFRDADEGCSGSGCEINVNHINYSRARAPASSRGKGKGSKGSPSPSRSPAATLAPIAAVPDSDTVVWVIDAGDSGRF